MGETGLSVPDAEMLIRISGILETPVSDLLGEIFAPSEDADPIKSVSLQLEKLNQRLARKAERNRKIGRGVSIAVSLIAFLILAGDLCALLWSRFVFSAGKGEAVSVIGGADGPTAIIVSSQTPHPFAIVFLILVMTGGIAGILLTRKK